MEETHKEVNPVALVEETIKDIHPVETVEESFLQLQEIVTQPQVILVFVVVFATVVANYLARKLLLKLEEKTSSTQNIWDDALAKSIRRPLAWLIWVMGIGFAARVLADGSDSLLEEIINPTQFVAIVGLVAFFLTRFVTEAENNFIVKGADITTTHAVGRLLRISVIITALLSVLQSMGVNISGLLAFGGIGGIAVGFAAKDLLHLLVDAVGNREEAHGDGVLLTDTVDTHRRLLVLGRHPRRLDEPDLMRRGKIDRRTRRRDLPDEDALR